MKLWKNLLLAGMMVGAVLTPAAHAQEFDYGMDPHNPSDPALPLPGPNGPITDIPVVGHKLYDYGFVEPSLMVPFIPSLVPQYEDPRFPEGRAHLPKATIDLQPQILKRLEVNMHVDGSRIRQINAFSPSMGRTIPLVWIPARDNSVPRPTLYVLAGSDGGQGADNWITRTDMVDFFADKNVNIVLPLLGAFSFYTDWEEEAPSMGGKQMWETFLTHELPEPLEQAIGANGQRSIMGMSMSGGSVLNYAEHNPGFYSSVGSFSGCAEMNSFFGRWAVGNTMTRARTKPSQMLGFANSPRSRYYDAVLNAERLREQPNVYVSNASGMMGDFDYSGPHAPRNEQEKAIRRNVGFIIEAGTNHCTHSLQARTKELGIFDNITFDYLNAGTHSWGIWQESMHRFWPIMARGFGLNVPVPPMNGNGPALSNDTSSELYGSSGSSVFGGSSAYSLNQLLGFSELSSAFGSSELSADLATTGSTAVGESSRETGSSKINDFHSSELLRDPGAQSSENSQSSKLSN